MMFANGTLSRRTARQDKRWSSTGVLHCDTGYLALKTPGPERMLGVVDRFDATDVC